VQLPEQHSLASAQFANSVLQFELAVVVLAGLELEQAPARQAATTTSHAVT
jgi:hypothetical protein